MPTTPGTGLRLPTTTTRTTVTLSFQPSRVTQREHVTIDEVFDAYYDCRRHKRSKRSAVDYEMRYELNNYELWRELNTMIYKPTTSIAFCVTRPKLREVFAANFRDRVVHHLFIGKINAAVERRLTDCTCACRKEKGTLYAIRRVAQQLRCNVNVNENQNVNENKNGWYARLDIKGFFMSIDKTILMPLVREVVMDSVEEDVDWWLWLAETIIMHRPEEDCDIHGRRDLWQYLPDNKTLFRTNGRGVPIGNLPSQVLANLYLADFDRFIISRVGEHNYTRYADDFIITCDDKNRLLRLIADARVWLAVNRRLSLHPRKVALQPVSRGVLFTGCFIKNGIIHAGSRLRKNAIGVCEDYNSKDIHTDKERVDLRNRFNSYCGLLKHTASYRIRRKMWRRIGEYKYFYIKNMSNLKIKQS